MPIFSKICWCFVIIDKSFSRIFSERFLISLHVLPLVVLCSFTESDHVKADGTVWEPFNCDVPGDNGYTFAVVDGVFQITGCRKDIDGKPNTKKKPVIHPFPCIEEFMEDQNVLLALSSHGPVYVFFFCSFSDFS